VCWSDEKYNLYCHPIASKFIPGYEVATVVAGDLNSDIRIQYPGAWSMQMQIKITCNPYVHDSAFDLGSSGIVVTDGQPGQLFTFNATNHRACARQFSDGVIPDTPRGQPPNNLPALSELNQAVGGGEHVWVNLKHIKEIKGTVPLGTARDEYV
jgi:hypothetical protein